MDFFDFVMGISVLLLVLKIIGVPPPLPGPQGRARGAEGWEVGSMKGIQVGLSPITNRI